MVLYSVSMWTRSTFDINPITFSAKLIFPKLLSNEKPSLDHNIRATVSDNTEKGIANRDMSTAETTGRIFSKKIVFCTVRV